MPSSRDTARHRLDVYSLWRTDKLPELKLFEKPCVLAHKESDINNIAFCIACIA